MGGGAGGGARSPRLNWRKTAQSVLLARGYPAESLAALRASLHSDVITRKHDVTTNDVTTRSPRHDVTGRSLISPRGYPTRNSPVFDLSPRGSFSDVTGRRSQDPSPRSSFTSDGSSSRGSYSSDPRDPHRGPNPSDLTLRVPEGTQRTNSPDHSGSCDWRTDMTLAVPRLVRSDSGGNVVPAEAEGSGGSAHAYSPDPDDGLYDSDDDLRVSMTLPR